MSETVWKFIKTGLDGSTEQEPCLFMEPEGYAHCCWVEGATLRYSACYGDEWTFLGDGSAVTSSESTLAVSQGTIFVDSNYFPHLVYMDGVVIKHACWDGKKWLFEDVFNSLGNDVVGWGGCYQPPDPLVVVATKTPFRITLKMFRKSGTWSSSDYRADRTDNSDLMLSVAVTDQYIYAFWKSMRATVTKAGYTFYSLFSGTWDSSTSGAVPLTEDIGEITGMYFFPEDYDFSSSSSSSTELLTTSSSVSSSTLGMSTSSEST